MPQMFHVRKSDGTSATILRPQSATGDRRNDDDDDAEGDDVDYDDDMLVLLTSGMAMSLGRS